MEENLTPAIILVEPQLGENVGMCARAMKNFAFTDLRVVSPRHKHGNQQAVKASAGGIDILENARIFDTLEDAASDLHILYAVTARPRDMDKRVITPADLHDDLKPFKGRAGFVFGREKSGLTNDDISKCDAILTIPANPAYSSLNLAQAVLVICYHYSLGQFSKPALAPQDLAPKDQFFALMQKLETYLDNVNYFVNLSKKPSMLQMIYNLFHRAQLNRKEIEGLQGIFRALHDAPKKPRK